MRLFVLACGALLALALAFVLIASGPDALVASLRSQSVVQQIAWMLMLVATLLVLGTALWLNEQLLQHRNAMHTLQSRLRAQEAESDVDVAVIQFGGF